MDDEQVRELLKGSPLFTHLDESSLANLFGRSIRRSYRRGERIFHQGDLGDSTYVVVAGLVKIAVVSSSGEEMVLATLTQGDTFGELAMIDGMPRSATAEAAEPTDVLMITRSLMMEMLVQEPTMIESLLKSLGGMIRRLTEQTSDLVFMDLHARVAKLLVKMAEQHGSKSEQGLTLDLSLTQGDLASMVGGSRQSVNQILRSFESRRYIEMERGTIVIKEIDQLRHRADR